MIAGALVILIVLLNSWREDASFDGASKPTSSQTATRGALAFLPFHHLGFFGLIRVELRSIIIIVTYRADKIDWDL
jgi:hypothetical protein